MFKRGLSREYKDLVQNLLIQNPEKRLPVVRIFAHPWVIFFQKKYKIERAVTPQDSEDEAASDDDLTSSEDEDYHEEYGTPTPDTVQTTLHSFTDTAVVE